MPCWRAEQLEGQRAMFVRLKSKVFPEKYILAIITVVYRRRLFYSACKSLQTSTQCVKSVAPVHRSTGLPETLTHSGQAVGDELTRRRGSSSTGDTRNMTIIEQHQEEEGNLVPLQMNKSQSHCASRKRSAKETKKAKAKVGAGRVILAVWISERCLFGEA